MADRIDIEISEMSNARIEEFDGAPGESMFVDLATYGDNVDDSEFYHMPGSVGMPQDEEIGLKINCKGLNIIVGSHNYKLELTIDKGEHIIFAYDSDGAIKSKIHMKADGNIEASNDNGFFKLKDDGQFTANDNLTVDA